MNILSSDDLKKRVHSVSPDSHEDYLSGEQRRILSSGKEVNLENCIFEEAVSICLKEIPVSVSIVNCEFKKGLKIRRGELDAGYSIFLYKCSFTGKLELPSFDAVSKITVDTCEIDQMGIYGKSSRIDLFGSKIGILKLDNLKCDIFRSAQTEIQQFGIEKISADDVEFDTDNLAISDYSRFINQSHQSRKEVSEQYHRFVLKSAKSIRAKSNINYQLNKSTSAWTGIFFGYFYKPLYVVLWIIAIVVLYALIYVPILNITFRESLYYSINTFLTIGFSDISEHISFTKIILVFTEGLLGLVYAAALLTAIINSSRK